MSKRTLYLLLALVVFGSVALAASQGDTLQGAFKNTTLNSTAVLTMNANSSSTKESPLYWGGSDSNETDTLGVWKFKTSDSLTINGFALHLGVPLGAGTANANSVGTFFKNCTGTLSESGASTTVSSINCNFAYQDLSLDSGKTYTFTVTGTPMEDAWESFADGDYSGEEVSISLLGLTKSNGTVLHYYDSSIVNAVNAEASTSFTDTHNNTYGTYTLEYSYGGYTLQNMVYQVQSDTKSLPVNTSNSVLQNNTQTYQTKNSFTTKLTESVGTTLTSKNIGVTLPSSGVSSDLTINISNNGSTIKISNGSSTKTCTSGASGSFNCQIP